jgi:hypothetical protein
MVQLKYKFAYSLAMMLSVGAFHLFSADFSLFTDDMPSLTYSESAYGQQLLSPVEGKIIDKQTIDDLTSIAISREENYYYDGKIKTVHYEIWIVGIVKYENLEKVSSNQLLGTIGKTTRIAAVYSGLDEYLLRSTDSKPVLKGTAYFYSPQWIAPTSTAFLSFRQVDSFENAVMDFYRRWFDEEDKSNDSDSTIHYYPEFDRIRIKITLDSYPVQANRINGLTMTELVYYQPGLFTHESPISTDCPYQPVIYWQPGFFEYLRDEYEIGNDIFIYCSIYTLDHSEKKIIVCARDFSLVSDEDIVNQRLKDLLNE